ncbi:MAG TPA: PIN domain-containing protein, partial [Actinomycetota bacterium]|nr:PIN domain-containing protein [Actinomycetota bacterium]
RPRRARDGLTVYCFDTDVLSAVIRRDPPLALIRRLAQTPPEQQFTTAVTLGELLYGAARRGSAALTRTVRDLVIGSRDLIVVTGNTRHFNRVPDLEVENWLALS